MVTRVSNANGKRASKLIAVNGRFLALPISGIERYAREVWSRLSEEEARVIEPKVALPSWRGLVWEQTALPMRLQRNEVLLSLTNLGPLAVRRQLLVIHDVAVFDHPEWFSTAVKRTYEALLPVLAKRVAVCVTDSEFSRQRIVERLGIDEDLVKCIYPGCASGFRNRIEGLERSPYVLAYGADDPRKNFRRLLEAWTEVRRQLPGYTLKVFGRPSRLFGNTFVEDWTGVEILGYVPDEELPALYQQASLLVYPSLYEGFGLPVLEALVSGTPVVASDIEVFRELFDGSVIFVDPLDAHSIANGILSSLLGGTAEEATPIEELESRYNFDLTVHRLRETVSQI